MTCGRLLFSVFVNCQRVDSILQRGNVPLPGQSSGRPSAAAPHVESGNSLLPLRRLPSSCPSQRLLRSGEGHRVHLAYAAIGPRRPRKGPVATCIPCLASQRGVEDLCLLGTRRREAVPFGWWAPGRHAGDEPGRAPALGDPRRGTRHLARPSPGRSLPPSRPATEGATAYQDE